MGASTARARLGDDAEAFQGRLDRMRTDMGRLLQERYEIEAILHDLTPTETRILDIVLDGQANLRAARAIGMHPRAYNKHIAEILRKFGVHSRGELFAFIFRRTK